MNINPLFLAAMCFVCTWLGYLIGKRNAARQALKMALDLSDVLDLHLAAIEPENMPLRRH